MVVTNSFIFSMAAFLFSLLLNKSVNLLEAYALDLGDSGTDNYYGKGLISTKGDTDTQANSNTQTTTQQTVLTPTVTPTVTPSTNKANYSEVEKLIEEFKKLNKDDYTSDSYNKVVELINSIDWNLPKDKQSTVDQYAKDLREAISKLVKKSSGAADGKIPYTGEMGTAAIVAGLVGIAGLAGFGFMRYRKINK